MSKNISAPLLRKNLVNFGIVLAVLIFVFACTCPNGRNTGQGTNTSNPSGNSTTTSNSGGKKTTTTSNDKDDNGDFIVEHGSVTNPRYVEIDKQIKNEKVLEGAAQQLNENLKLPNDVYLRTKDCGEVNAFYDPNDTSITICYELMEHFFKLFKSAGKNDKEAYQRMFEAIQFVFLHELGHAMIDLYKLPITANEEDAADRASAYICLEEIKDGVKFVLTAADAFAIESKMRKPDGRDMADEHLLGEQRYFNSLCMIYGSNPGKWNKIVTDGYLPKERAVRCPQEYERTMLSWKELLKPWRKN
jgi:hypothetical protein